MSDGNSEERDNKTNQNILTVIEERSEKRSHEYIIGGLLENIARKVIDESMMTSTFELYRQYNTTGDIAEHTAQIFQLGPLPTLGLLKAVYLAQDAANHIAKVYDTPPMACAVDYAVLGDTIWSGLVLGTMARRYPALKGILHTTLLLTSPNTFTLGTSLVAKKDCYVNNHIQGLVEELFGTDHLVVTIAKKSSLLKSKVMADIFEARIAYFWDAFGPSSPFLFQIVDQLIIIMDYFRALKKSQVHSFIDTYHKGRYFRDTPLGMQSAVFV
jgi:hypothetical protein